MSIDVALKHQFRGFSLDAEFRIARPGVTALFGPSGAGKTTIVQALAGLFRPEQGRIAIEGRVVLDTATGIAVPAARRRMGYVFQDARLFPHMDVGTNLRYGWRRAEARASEGEIAHVVDLLGLSHLLNRNPRLLSGGERQRVALGRALLSSPQMLLLDEPLSALDNQRKSEILPYLERLRDEAKLPMLYVSHALDEVARLAQDIVVLKEGRVAAQGSVFDLMPMLDATSGSLFRATVTRHRDDGLSELGFAGGTLYVPRLDRAAGTGLRVRILAQDIMLALEEPRAVSANNVLNASIASIARESGHADVAILCGGTKLVARITEASAARLALAPGMDVYAVIKAVTVAPQT